MAPRGPDAVALDGLGKKFRLTHDRNWTLKATVLAGHRTRYEEFWALRGIDLEIPHGSTFGIIGGNGSGKSTLLKVLAGIMRPDEGTAEVDGRLSALLELGAGFHPELTGRENVYLNGAILGFTSREIRRRFDDIVGFAELDRFIDEPVRNYSSGMYVRLGFSVAIHVEPDILLVDEVLAVGDHAFQKRCLDRFAQLKAEGRTIILVSHDLDMVGWLCEQTAWIQQGTLQAVGPSLEVIDRFPRGWRPPGRHPCRPPAGSSEGWARTTWSPRWTCWTPTATGWTGWVRDDRCASGFGTTPSVPGSRSPWHSASTGLTARTWPASTRVRRRVPSTATAARAGRLRGRGPGPAARHL